VIAVLIGGAAAIAYVAARDDATRPAVSSAHDIPNSTGPVHLDSEAARRAGVTFATVEQGTLATEIRTVGQVVLDETRVKAIAPKIEGWVEQLHVDFTGRSVREGEPLLSLYSPMLVAAQEELLLALRLLKDVDAGAEDATRSAADLVASARRRLSYWDVPAADVAALEQSGTVTKTVVLRSPVEGVVVEKSVLAGQRIMAGETLFQVADLGTVWIEGEIFERDLASVRLGARVAVEVQAYPGEQRHGAVTYVHPTVDPATRTTRVRVELANPGLRLRPGMYATIRLTGAQRTDAVTIPRSAVLATGRRVIAFVRVSDGMLEPREIAIGLTSDDRVEVLHGLRAGEVVVSSATFLVDAESNLAAAMGAMAKMPGMSGSGHSGPAAGDARLDAAPGTEVRSGTTMTPRRADTARKTPPASLHLHRPE
jgi:Cu(I)/Ag(I) efflux system membrane fusion protein